MLTKTRIYAHHDRGLRQGHINFLMSCHYFAMFLQFKGRPPYQYWQKNILDRCDFTYSYDKIKKYIIKSKKLKYFCFACEGAKRARDLPKTCLK